MTSLRATFLAAAMSRSTVRPQYGQTKSLRAPTSCILPQRPHVLDVYASPTRSSVTPRCLALCAMNCRNRVVRERVHARHGLLADPAPALPGHALDLELGQEDQVVVCAGPGGELMMELVDHVCGCAPRFAPHVPALPVAGLGLRRAGADAVGGVREAPQPGVRLAAAPLDGKAGRVVARHERPHSGVQCELSLLPRRGVPLRALPHLPRVRAEGGRGASISLPPLAGGGTGHP